MKNTLYILFTILILSFGCKSKKEITKTDIQYNKDLSIIETKERNINNITSNIDFSSSELEIIKFEPVYYTKDGKDTVELKEVKYKKINKSKKTEDVVINENTKEVLENKDIVEITDKTIIEKEKKGFDLIKSVILGIITGIGAIFGNFIWLFPIVLIIIKFRAIKNFIFPSSKGKETKIFNYLYIQKFINYMKNLLNKFIIWVKGLFGNLFEKFKGSAKIAIDITAKLKLIVESELFDVAVDLIPGNIDNIILDKVRQVLPLVIKKVSLVGGIVSESDSSSEAIEKFIQHLRLLNPEGRKAFWVTFAAEMNIALSDGKLTFAEAIILTQLTYAEFSKK